MTDGNDNNERPARQPMSLKPRASVSAGTVKQSFSHGRTKTVVVETRRSRAPGAPAERPAGPRPNFELRPRTPAAPASPTPAATPAPTGADGRGLSSEEMEARRRAIATAQAEADRRSAEQRAEDDARRAQEEARRREAAAARAAEDAARTPPPAEVAPSPTPTPAAAKPVAPKPAPEAPRPVAAAPVEATPPVPAPPAPPAEPERPQVNFGQRAPREDRPTPSFGQRAPREERPQVAGYGAPPRPAAARPQGYGAPAAREGAQGYGAPRTARPEAGGFGARPAAGGAGGYGARPAAAGGYGARPGPGARPESGGGYGARPGGAGAGGGARPEGGYGARPAGPRPEGGYGARPRPEGGAAGGEGSTVRYSALSARPGPGGARPAGARPAGGGLRPGVSAPPSGPEFTRPARSGPGGAGRPGLRRPGGDDDDRRGPGAPKGALSRQRGAPERRQGRLTIQAVAGDDGDAAERMRSLASVRRAREREREKRKGGEVDAGQTSREVVIPDVITVQELAQRMTTRAVDVIKSMMRQGMMLKITDVLDADTAELIATDFGHTVRRVSESDVEEGFIDAEDEETETQTRPPVVAVMGHVDHGKTSLLDALRSTDVTKGEAGGITQHIGAYQVRLEDGSRVTFLDTPGHAAFSAMRARGADVTDIVVLVVAADDGVMPQTIEAINHAKAAGTPIIVAVNKIDKPDADPTRVVNELLQHEIVAESLGGDTQIIEVSATQKLGLEDLVEAISLQAEVMDLRANPDRTAEGSVIEAKLDKGRGSVATVLVNRGTLKRGDIVVAGSAWGRVRALVNERGEQVQSAGPSDPVEVLGLDQAPNPGDLLAVVEDEARARELTAYRDRVRREKNVVPIGGGASLAEMMAKLQDKQVRELPVVIKADVQGSAEAIQGSLNAMGTDEVRARMIHSGVGGITESDVSLAKASGAPIIAFNVRASKQARDQAERDNVEIRYYSIIYDLLDDIKGVLSGMLPPAQREDFLGYAAVLEVFDITKTGKVAGCRVTEGVVRRGAKVRIIRENIVVLELGTLQSLRRFKDDVQEVGNNVECGMTFQGFQDIRVGDQIECFTVEQVARTLA